MPTFAQLCETSASKGGMEKTIEFRYDENVAVVMAAFRERSQTPHPSMPLVHRVDILEERAESTAAPSHVADVETHLDAEEGDAGFAVGNVGGEAQRESDLGGGDEAPGEDNTEGWGMRLRRFFAANDAPEWVRKVSGGDYLRGTELIEWSEAEVG